MSVPGSSVARSVAVMADDRLDPVDPLAIQRTIPPSDADFDAFVADLASPPAPNPRLRRLMAEESPYEHR